MSFCVVTAIQIPMPILARASVYVKPIHPAWIQMRFLTLPILMIIAPIGKKSTKATGARIAWAMRTSVPLELPPLSDCEVPDEPLDVPVVEDDVDAAVVKGFELLPPAAFWRLKVVVPKVLC